MAKPVALPSGFVLDDMPEGFVLDSIPEGFALDSPEPDTVPEWGRKNPNLYGAYGAVKETALTAGRAMKNLPGDTLRLAGDIAETVTTKTPVDVGMDIGKVVTGAAGKLIPGEQPYEQDFDALANVYKSKYGSLANLKKTIEEKPAEFLADITGAMTGSGAGLKAAGLKTAGKAVTEAGVKLGTAPHKAYLKAGEKAVEGVKKVAGKVTPSPEKLYASAAKWPTTDKTRMQTTNTLLKEDIGLNPQGYEKLTSTIDDLNEQIKGQIKPYASKSIDTKQVSRWTVEARSKAMNTLDRDKNLAKIQDVVNDFQKTWGDQLTVGKAQAIKQDIYKELKRHYDAKAKGGSVYTDAEVAARKNIARGLKKEIERATGGKIRDLNARESALLNAEPHLRRAVGRIENHNILSLDDVLAATAGGVVGGPAGAAFFGVARKTFGSPSAKARMAIEIYKAQQKTGGKVKASIKTGASGKTLAGAGAMESLTDKERAILRSNISDADKERFLKNLYDKEGK